MGTFLNSPHSAPCMADPIMLGTVALDSIETPFGKIQDALGGSATFSSIAASFFSKPGIISIIGKDFPRQHLDFIRSKGIDTDGIAIGNKTFRWSGYYEFDMNEAKTRSTELNDLATYDAQIPESYRGAKYVFLGNMDPVQQLKVLESMKHPRLIVLDTMNFWIQNKKEDLMRAIKRADILVCNDGEARQLFQTANLVKAANKALELVSTAVIIKKGEHGALLFTNDFHFSAPGYPLEDIKDPTGCGDCFGGGFIGYLAHHNIMNAESMKKAVVYGSVVASYNAEGFGTERLKTLTMDDIKQRYQIMKDIREF